MDIDDFDPRDNEPAGPTIHEALADMDAAQLREILGSVFEDADSGETDADYRAWIRKCAADTLCEYVALADEAESVRREQAADWAQEQRSQINAMNRGHS